jgi:hypothetical protein
VCFLGYLLQELSSSPKWKCVSNENHVKKFFDLYSLPQSDQGNGKQEFYAKPNTNGSDKLVIWGVGGKNGFKRVLKDIYNADIHHPEERIENIVIVTDRDQDDVMEKINDIEKELNNLGWQIKLENNRRNKATYQIEDENYDVYICPIVIPFNENGALETVLMNAISHDAPENAYVVGQAKQYVSTVYESGKAKKYLRHARQRVKAEFSSVMSVINPGRSTAKFNKLLKCYDWEKSEIIKEHFKLLKEIFNLK